MEFKINALSIYEFGQRKDKDGNPHQEDWLYPALGEINNEKDRLFILCDGMGGHAAGEVASAAVCEAMSKTINKALEKGDKFSEQLLLDAIDAAYDLLDERDTTEEGQKKMGTTMTFLMLHEGGATIAHIGDSRVYHIRPKNGNKADVVSCTRDHSLVNDLIKIGELTEEEALTHPQKNVITRAMQPNLEHRHKADITTKKNIRPGDYFYMCSDGMLEQTSDDNLCFMLANDVTDEEKRDMLIKVSKNNHDNHSAHLIHILDVQPETEIENEPLPPSTQSVEENDDDEDVVNPEFEDSDIPASTDNTDKEVTASQPKDIKKGKNASATSSQKSGTTDNVGGRGKFMWGFLACFAVTVLALAGYFVPRFLGSRETDSVDGDSVKVTTPDNVRNNGKKKGGAVSGSQSEMQAETEESGTTSASAQTTTPSTTAVTPSAPAEPVAPVQTSNEQVTTEGASTPDTSSSVQNVKKAVKSSQTQEDADAVQSVESIIQQQQLK